MNILVIESLQKFHDYYGDDFRVECPTRSGQFRTLDQVAAELSRRLASIFLKNEAGARQVNALYPKFQRDPNYCDYITFSDDFDGDAGGGGGASHQPAGTGIRERRRQPRAPGQPKGGSRLRL